MARKAGSTTPKPGAGSNGSVLLEPLSSPASGAQSGASVDIPAAPDPGNNHRQRLIRGMAHAVREKGYVETTIADIVASARVSRRTFYEHFADKEACLLACYETFSTRTLEAIAGAIDEARPVYEQLESATRAYFASLQADPLLLQSLFIEISAVGPDGIKARRAVHQRFERLVLGLSQRAAAETPGTVPLNPLLATALVGGINELALQAIEAGRLDQLAVLHETATVLVRGVFVRRSAVDEP